MAAIGSLIFCTDCGNLLPPSKGSEKNILHCDCCGAENRGRSGVACRGAKIGLLTGRRPSMEDSDNADEAV